MPAKVAKAYATLVQTRTLAQLAIPLTLYLRPLVFVNVD